jgi:mannose-6-phosphate isomerase, class I
VDVVAGGHTGMADETSFVSLLITEGEGRLTCGGETVQAKKGDSFFITAGSGAYALTGSCKALLTTV